MEDPDIATSLRAEIVVEPVHELEALREDWSALGERTGNLFATWEWNSIWWQHLGAGRPLAAAACRDEAGALVGLLPMYLASAAGPVRVIRLLGHGQGDRLGPICLPADRPRVAAALRVALRAKPWTNAFILAENLPAEEGWKELLGARRLGREASPVIEIGTRDWDDFLTERSAHLRRQVHYQERRLARKHAVRYRLITDEDELPAALDAMFIEAIEVVRSQARLEIVRGEFVWGKALFLQKLAHEFRHRLDSYCSRQPIPKAQPASAREASGIGAK